MSVVITGEDDARSKHTPVTQLDRQRASRTRRSRNLAAMASISSLNVSALASICSLRAVSGELAGAGAQTLGHFSSPTCGSAAPAPSATPQVVQPCAKRVCDLTGKKANNGYRVSFSNHRTKHLQGANLQYKRLWWEEKNRFVKLRISTRALKTIEKKGLSVMAKEAGIDLDEYLV